MWNFKILREKRWGILEDLVPNLTPAVKQEGFSPLRVRAPRKVASHPPEKTEEKRHFPRHHFRFRVSVSRYSYEAPFFVRLPLMADFPQIISPSRSPFQNPTNPSFRILDPSSIWKPPFRVPSSSELWRRIWKRRFFFFFISHIQKLGFESPGPSKWRRSTKRASGGNSDLSWNPLLVTRLRLRRLFEQRRSVWSRRASTKTILWISCTVPIPSRSSSIAFRTMWEV